MGTALGACPMRKVTGAKRTAKTVDEHIDWLKEYLYEEGPQTARHLASKLGLAESRTLEILHMGSLEGAFTLFRRNTTAYWMLDESH